MNVLKLNLPPPRHHRKPHELKSLLVIVIELAKLHYSVDEIAEILGDETELMLNRPTARLYDLLDRHH